MKIEVQAELCRDCEACALACSVLHEGESNPLLSRVLIQKDMANYKFHIVICEQCQTEGHGMYRSLPHGSHPSRRRGGDDLSG
jgi:Fe-S-cluster-containing hydrogenase component 2